MLSVLVPVYNYDVGPLALQLQTAAKNVDCPVEIIFLDDGSHPPFQQTNRGITGYSTIQYQELAQNVGRAAIRNKLAAMARYPHLLFLDADSGLPDAHFLARYVSQLPHAGVVYGGRVYSPTPPDDDRLYLHWYYGTHRESRPLAKRQRTPYAHFMTNNFCIAKAALEQVPLEETLRGYGHEDTLLGWQLQAAGVPIVHIDNPVVHLGLEPADGWLRKQYQAIDNLAALHRAFPQLMDTRLLTAWRWLRKTGLMPRLARWTLSRQLILEKKLTSARPPALWTLDLLKLAWLEERGGDTSVTP